MLAAPPADHPGQLRGKLMELHLQQLIVEYALLEGKQLASPDCCALQPVSLGE